MDRPDALVLRVDGVEEKAAVFAALRDVGICFSWGSEWNPVEVFQWLCEKDLRSGPFRRIACTRPGEFHLRQMR